MGHHGRMAFRIEVLLEVTDRSISFLCSLQMIKKFKSKIFFSSILLRIEVNYIII